MKSAEFQAVYVMWLRQVKRFIRSKSRLVSTVLQPIFFLFFLGSGFRNASFEGVGNYISFLAPGIISMAILFSSMFTGVSILWDRKFGFLQEVLVAPVSRFSIILGRTFGGATMALIQGLIILFISLALGVSIAINNIPLVLIFMMFTAFTAVGIGLVFASRMEDFQGFQLIMNLFILPLLFLSSAFFPVTRDPMLKTIAMFNPLFYMVDGLRGSLLSNVTIGNEIVNTPFVDLVVVVLFCLAVLGLGSYLFSKSEV